MADRIFDPEDADHEPTTTDFDGGWHTFGSRAPISEACDLVGGSVWFPNPEPANFRWIVYQVSDESVVAEVDLSTLSSPTLGDWNDFTSAAFVDPGDVALDPEEEYVVAYATNGDFTFRDSGVSFPYGAGIVTAVEARFFNGGSGATFPDSTSTAFVFPADMIVEAGGGTPVAVTGLAAAAATSTSTVKKIVVAVVRSAAAAASTGAAKKIVVAVGTSAAAAGTTSSASKVAKAAGTGCAAGTTTSTAKKLTTAGGLTAGTAATTAGAAKVAQVTAVCSAVTAVSSAAVTVRPTVSTTAAAAASSATAAKRATVGGAAYAIATSYKAGADIRSVTATCYAIATSTARRRLTIRRPNTGTIVRPNTGVILRP